MVAVLAGMPNVPGVTVNRYCSSSLQTIRMAAHAIKAGEGDIFIAAGVETVSRFMNGMADTGPHNPLFADAEARTTARTAGGQGAWTAPVGLPDVYIAMGQTAENVAEFENVSREEMDEFAALSQQRATAALERGFFEREITPITTARRHRRDQGRRHPARHHGRGPVAGSSRCSAPTVASRPATPARSTTAPPP